MQYYPMEEEPKMASEGIATMNATYGRRKHGRRRGEDFVRWAQLSAA
jgi:hypothetical protein